MEKLNPKSVWVFFSNFLITGCMIYCLLVVLFGFYFLNLFFEGKSILFVGGTALILSFYAIFCYIWARLTYNSWRYELTENVFKLERGVIYKKYASIPYERIQNVDIHRGLIARILKLSVLRIQTAGLSGRMGAEGSLPGLSIEKAEQLREELITKVKGTKQGL